MSKEEPRTPFQLFHGSLVALINRSEVNRNKDRILFHN